MLACYPLMADMDECDTDLACYLRARHRAASQLGASVQRSMKMLVFTCRPPVDGTVERLLFVIFHASIFLRKMLLPSLVASTTVVILVAASGEASFDAVSTFLNVIAVGFSKPTRQPKPTHLLPAPITPSSPRDVLGAFSALTRGTRVHGSVVPCLQSASSTTSSDAC